MSISSVDPKVFLGTGPLAPMLGSLLPLDLQRQILHVAHEFIRLKATIPSGPETPRGPQNDLARVFRKLQRFFVQDLACRNGGCDLNELREIQKEHMARAKLAEATLREIRALNGTSCFFSRTLQLFYRTFASLDVADEQFAVRLRSALEAYRQERDTAEAEFLKPYHAYLDEIRGILRKAYEVHQIPNSANVEVRIKRNILSKIHQRVESGNGAEFFDLVGLRVVVRNQREVDATLALIQGAFLVHTAQAELRATREEVPHYFAVDNIEPHKKNSGYRATHLNIRRRCPCNGEQHPTAEIQIMSRGIYEWAAIQRSLIYKDVQIPENVKSVINAYCSSAAYYITAKEDGLENGPLPDIDNADILALTTITDEDFRWDVLARICDMDALVRRYETYTDPSMQEA